MCECFFFQYSGLDAASETLDHRRISLAYVELYLAGIDSA